MQFTSQFTRRLLTFKQYLSVLLPLYMCIYCGKMLYENQLNKYSKDNFLDEWLRYINKSNIKLMCCDEKYYYLCNTCSGHYKRKKHIYIFHQFCDIPKEINSINNYYDINQFTLINMYCNTLKKPGFSYWHLNGQINLSYKK